LHKQNPVISSQNKLTPLRSRWLYTVLAQWQDLEASCVNWLRSRSCSFLVIWHSDNLSHPSPPTRKPRCWNSRRSHSVLTWHSLQKICSKGAVQASADTKLPRDTWPHSLRPWD